MKKIVILYLLLLYCLTVWPQTQPDFKPLRYCDNFSNLRDSTRNIYEKIKHIPFGKSSDYYASVGGELRWQYINTTNNKWGDEPDDSNGYLLSRYLFHTDMHLGMFRMFGQLQSSLANSMPHPSPVDENVADIHQLFFDFNFVNNKEIKIYTRFGRQEMLYGSQRLIGVREGPNSRLSFDGLKAVFINSNFRADAFYTHPIANIPGAFNDTFNKKVKLWGVYTVFNNVTFFKNLNVYYLGLWKNESVYDNVSGREVRNSIGARIWNNTGNWNYDIETIYQFGKISDKAITAWTISTNINYRFSSAKFTPVIGLKTEIISGDEKTGDNKIQTFNPLYPRGAYFGLVALIGPANLYDIHPSIDLALTDKLHFGADYDIFWRWSNNDGLYAPNMQLLYSGKDIMETFVGTQLIGDFEYTPNPYLTFTLEGAWFNAGPFLKEAGNGKDYYYTALTATFRF